MPSQKSTRLLSNCINYHKLAHLLREVRRAIQFSDKGGARLLEQIHLPARQVFCSHTTPDRHNRWFAYH